MQHTLYAAFENEADAPAAIHDLEAIGPPREHVGAFLHEGVLSAEELQPGETASPAGAARGAVAGGALGALLGGLIGGPIGIVGAGAIPAVLGGILGSASDGFMGAIAGSSSPSPELEALVADLKAGRVFVIVQAPGLADEEQAEAVVRKHRGRIERRHA